jgi:hypothetical protein
MLHTSSFHFGELLGVALQKEGDGSLRIHMVRLTITHRGSEYGNPHEAGF